MAGDFDYPKYDAGGRVQTIKEGESGKQWNKPLRRGPGPEDSPSMKEALRHKAGIEKSEKIERGIKKYPELFKHYKPFKKTVEASGSASSEESKYAEGGKVGTSPNPATVAKRKKEAAKAKKSASFANQMSPMQKRKAAEKKRLARVAKMKEERNMRKINKRALKLEKEKKGAGQDYVKVPKNVEPKKIKATGKIGKKPTSVTLTEGGAFPTYKKKSKKAGSFRSAFSEASKAGKKVFTWDGRKYSTKKK